MAEYFTAIFILVVLRNLSYYPGNTTQNASSLACKEISQKIEGKIIWLINSDQNLSYMCGCKEFHSQEQKLQGHMVVSLLREVQIYPWYGTAQS